MLFRSRMVKKILAVISILVILLITSLIVLPVIFKDDIVQLVKDGANDNLNALVNFGDFDLSLISSFQIGRASCRERV